MDSNLDYWPGMASGVQEVELKLELTPEAAGTLLASSLPEGDSKLLRLRTTYFDTSDRLLSKAGFSIRIREQGDVRVQTIKAVGSAVAGLFARPEWEHLVDGDEPVLDDTTPVRALLGAKVNEIVPMFEIQVERRVWNKAWDNALIEIVLDRGQVVASDRSAPICEIELELKQGTARALFSLARHLGEIAPLHVGVISKAERGLSLLGPVNRSFKSEVLQLSQDMSAATAFQQIAASCLRQYRLNEPFIHRHNPEATHQARVALRRLRSAFSIFAPILADETFALLREETKWLANTLGEARDLDVLLSDAAIDDDTRNRLAHARSTAYDNVLSAILSLRARELMLNLSEWLALGDWLSRPESAEFREQPVLAFAIAALNGARRKVKRVPDLDTLTQDDLHKVRKDAKKLRYAAEFFVSLFDEKRRTRRANRFLAALSSLQDLLGTLHDIAVAKKILGKDPSTTTDGPDKRRTSLLKEAVGAHDTFCDAKPFWR